MIILANKEELQDFIRKLIQSNKLVVVEGIKDKNSLKRLGVTNYIVLMNKKPIFQTIEDISKITKDAIILTDFDKKGKELYGRLKSGLQRFGVKVDHYFREWLQRNTRLSHIEGMAKYIESQS